MVEVELVDIDGSPVGTYQAVLGAGDAGRWWGCIVVNAGQRVPEDMMMLATHVTPAGQIAGAGPVAIRGLGKHEDGWLVLVELN